MLFRSLDNARVLSDRGAALLVEQHDLTPERLAEEITALIGDRARLDGIAAAAREAGAHHRSDRLVRLVERVAAGESA